MTLEETIATIVQEGYVKKETSEAIAKAICRAVWGD